VYTTDRHGLVVDPGDEPQRICHYIREHNITVDAVVLTHVHFDHMLAARAVCDTCDAPLWVGVGDKEALQDPARNLSGWLPGSEPLQLTADRLLRDGDVITVGGDCLQVLATPGHTPGCICLLCGDMLLAGDTLFAGSMGRLDFPGGDEGAMLTSLRRLASLPPHTQVYPGHGPATTIGAEREWNPYLQ
jgi:glyoxylase-like metal-dependent hydrolase (beta-lactamase superfamily II)